MIGTFLVKGPGKYVLGTILVAALVIGWGRYRESAGYDRCTADYAVAAAEAADATRERIREATGGTIDPTDALDWLRRRQDPDQ